MSAQAPIPIDGPAPLERPFNLFTVATELPAGEVERWPNGVTVEPYPVDTPFGFDPCATGTFRQKTADTARPLPSFAALTGYVPVSCTRWSVRDDADLKRRVLARLLASDAFLAEHELASGQITGNPALADANVDSLGTGLDAVEGLARLEDAIAATGVQGVIHAPPSIVAAWGFDRVRVDGRVLRTTAGTPVIAGAGYVDVKPAAGGALGATKQWAYATGPVQYGRGVAHVTPETAGQATDRETNTTTFRAERALLVAWDTVLQAGVEIDRSA